MTIQLHKIISRMRLALIVGADIRSKLLLFYFGFIMPIQKRLFGVHIKPKPITIKAFQRTCTAHIMDGSDVAVLAEMFLDQEYAIETDGQPEVIMDLGSNVGLSVLYFKLRYPNARVHAFEPNPAAFERLQQNTAQFSDVTAYPVAVGKTDSEVRFFVHPESSMSSSLVDRKGQGMREITVPLFSLSTAIKNTNEKQINILKFDIEGAEYDLFSGLPQSLEQVKNIVGEIHLDLIDASEDEMWKCFKDFVITKIPISGRRYVVYGKNKTNNK